MVVFRARKRVFDRTAELVGGAKSVAAVRPVAAIRATPGGAAALAIA
jgi:hypothetical protein